MRIQPHALADRDAGLDDRVRADFGGGTNFGFRIDYGS
jgi:hypothetical protein